MLSSVRTNRSVTPDGCVAPRSPGRGPSHCTCHPGGQGMDATTPAHVVGCGDVVDADDLGGVVVVVVVVVVIVVGAVVVVVVAIAG